VTPCSDGLDTSHHFLEGMMVGGITLHDLACDVSDVGSIPQAYYMLYILDRHK